jgi:hypothetical protein
MQYTGQQQPEPYPTSHASTKHQRLHNCWQSDMMEDAYTDVILSSYPSTGTHACTYIKHVQDTHVMGIPGCMKRQPGAGAKHY